MVIIKLYDTIAIFSNEQWACKDAEIQKSLNDTFNIDDIIVSNVYQISKYNRSVHGLDGVALDAIALLKPEIIEYIPDKIPEEQEGVVI